MLSTKGGKCFKVIECTLFFGLCGLSTVFLWGALDKFNSGKTSFTQSEDPIKDLPTITVCFSNPDSRFEYEHDFKINYQIMFANESNSSTFLKEGQNSTLSGEIIHLQKMITRFFGNCYKISSILSDQQILTKSYTRFYVYFNKPVLNKSLLFVKLFFSSEKNSYGVVESNWKNGKLRRSQVDKGMAKFMLLTPEQHNFIATKSVCSSESYYECLGRNLKLTLNCSLISLPHLPICKNNKTNSEKRAFWEHLAKLKEVIQCPKLCKNLEYSGDVVYDQKLLYFKNATVGFGYGFSSNSIILYEEYLIVDIISVIGSVGGTLGMCIGFSFTGVISFLINILQHWIMIMKVKLSNHNKMKSRLQYFNENMEIDGQNSQIPKHNKIFQKLQSLYRKKVKHIDDNEKLDEKLNSMINAHFRNHMGYEFCHSEGGGLYLKNERYLKSEKYIEDQKLLYSKLAYIEKELEYIKTRGALRGWWGGRAPSQKYPH